MDKTMIGKWDKWYDGVKTMGSFRYGNTETYKLAADFLADIEVVEDWGTGMGGFKKVFNGTVIGVDGTKTPFVDIVADLRGYASNVDGIVMRHVLEHNYDWTMVLTNAINSFNKKFCLVIFTPFTEKTKEIAHNASHGVDVPDISFKQADIEHFFAPFKWRMEKLKSRTHYGVEYIYFIQK